MTSFDDEEAAAKAARARQQGLSIVRSHLQSHLSNNPDSSFVSWIATLHPENASISIDDRFFIPGNPWQIVYEETMLLDDDSDRLSSHQEEENDMLDDDHSSESWRLTAELLRRCSPIDVLVGSTLTLVTVVTVASLEVAALIIYCFEFVFSNLARMVNPPNLLTLWIYGIAELLYHLFAMVDSMLLLLSVGIGELLAAIQYGLSLLFGGCSFASTWHQAMRRIAHQIRARFRAPFSSPRRHAFGNAKALIKWGKERWQRSGQDDGPLEEDSGRYSAVWYAEDAEVEPISNRPGQSKSST